MCYHYACHSLAGSLVQVVGQLADLADLQRILDCSKNKMTGKDQQNMTVRLTMQFKRCSALTIVAGPGGTKLKMRGFDDVPAPC